MKIKEYKFKKCGYALGCEYSTLGGGRGYCPLHYGAYYARVRRGERWDTFKIPEDGSVLTEMGKRLLECRVNESHTYSRKKYTLMPVPSRINNHE